MLTASQFLASKLSIPEYVGACVAKIEEHKNLNVWAHIDCDRLIDQAWKAMKNPKHPMGGIPIGVKDIFNTQDMPTTHGSPLFANYNPGNDARVVTDLRRAGALIAGKTATSEFAVHAPTRVVHPLDPTRSVGTSSSGSAVAVATGMVPIALCSQTAASTIRPASYCGVYGFKPSFGTLPRTAMLKTTDTLDTVGIMARSIEDIQLAFGTMRVRGPNHPLVERGYERDRPSVKRIGVVIGPKSYLESQDVIAGIASLTRELSDFWEVEGIELPTEFWATHHVHRTIYHKSLSYYFRMEWAKDKNLFSHQLAKQIEEGLSIPAEKYHAACKSQDNMAASLEKLFNRYDVLLCPSAAEVAPTRQTDKEDHSLIWTMCRVPAISCPYMTGENGLPIGAQFVARRYDDYRLFRFIREVEERLAIPERIAA